MNAESEYVKNFLFVPKSEDYAQDFHKLCLECTNHNLTVLLVTRKPINLLRLISKGDKLEKEQLMKCIIMQFERIDDIVKKLLELHDWALLPVLIVIDLQSFVEDELAWQPRTATMELFETTTRTSTAMQCICLCIATLFNYMNSVEKRLLAMRKTECHVAHSIVLLGEQADILSQEQLELLINLYYYDGTAFDSYDEIKKEIATTWQTCEMK